MDIFTALEHLRQKFTSGNDIPVTRAVILREEYEALIEILHPVMAPTPEQREKVELTDAEIDEIWARHAMSDTFDCVHLLRDAIAADRARRGGAEAEPAVIRIGGEDFPRHIALEALGVAMNTTLTSGLQGFADRIKNDLHWSQYFEADHALLMEAIAELKRNRQTPQASATVPEGVELTRQEISMIAMTGFSLSTMHGQAANKLMPISDIATLEKFARAVIAADRAARAEPVVPEGWNEVMDMLTGFDPIVMTSSSYGGSVFRVELGFRNLVDRNKGHDLLLKLIHFRDLLAGTKQKGGAA